MLLSPDTQTNNVKKNMFENFEKYEKNNKKTVKT